MNRGAQIVLQELVDKDTVMRFITAIQDELMSTYRFTATRWQGYCDALPFIRAIQDELGY